MMYIVVELWGGMRDGEKVKLDRTQLGTDIILPGLPIENRKYGSLKYERLRYVQSGILRKGRHIYRFKGTE